MKEGAENFRPLTEEEIHGLNRRIGDFLSQLPDDYPLNQLTATIIFDPEKVYDQQVIDFYLSLSPQERAHYSSTLKPAARKLDTIAELKELLPGNLLQSVMQMGPKRIANLKEIFQYGTSEPVPQIDLNQAPNVIVAEIFRHIILDGRSEKIPLRELFITLPWLEKLFPNLPPEAKTIFSQINNPVLSTELSLREFMEAVEKGSLPHIRQFGPDRLRQATEIFQYINSRKNGEVN